MVVEILFNDVAGPAKHERNIRTGADRQPNISTQFDQCSTAASRAAIGGICTPEDERFNR